MKTTFWIENWEIVAHWVNHMYSLRFGCFQLRFEGGNLVLIALVPGNCFPFTFPFSLTLNWHFILCFCCKTRIVNATSLRRHCITLRTVYTKFAY